jgi:hypothetical protein
MQSPVYWHPKLYAFTMRLLYGSFYETRYTHLQKLIPDDCQLLEICMGDLYFYEHYLQKKNIQYSCADVNPVFVKAARSKSIDSRLMDMLMDEIPKSDYILIQGALYHSIPNQVEFIGKLLNSTNKQLIISESIKNVSNSGNGLTSYLGTFFSKAKSGQSRIKFTKEMLKETFSGFEKNIVHWVEPSDSQETIIVLQK